MKHQLKAGSLMVASLRSGVATSTDALLWCEKCDAMFGFEARSDREVASAACGEQQVAARLGQLRGQLDSKVAARKFAAVTGSGMPAAQQCAAAGVAVAAAVQQAVSQQVSSVAHKYAATQSDQPAQYSAAGNSDSETVMQHSQQSMQHEVAPKWAAGQNQCSAGRTVQNSSKGRPRGQRGNGRRLWRRRQLEFGKASGVGTSAEDSTEVAESNTEPGQAAQGAARLAMVRLSMVKAMRHGFHGLQRCGGYGRGAASHGAVAAVASSSSSGQLLAAWSFQLLGLTTLRLRLSRHYVAKRLRKRGRKGELKRRS